MQHTVHTKAYLKTMRRVSSMKSFNNSQARVYNCIAMVYSAVHWSRSDSLPASQQRLYDNAMCISLPI